MYCIRMNCHVNFDPGGKSSLPLILVLLITINLQFSEVLCSASSTDIRDERWQLRQELPGTRRAIHRSRDYAANSGGLRVRSGLRPSGSSSTSTMIEGQTNQRKEEVPSFKPVGYSREQLGRTAINSLSETFRNLLNKSRTSEPAADIPLHKNWCIDKIHRTIKSFRNKVNELNLGNGDEKLDALSQQKPLSINEGDIKKQDKSSWSHPSSGSVVNARIHRLKHIVKRQTDQKELGNIAENKTVSTEKLPSTKLLETTVQTTVPTTLSSKDMPPSTGTPPLQQSTSDSSGLTSAQVTPQKPTTMSPGIQSTIQQHLPTTQRASTQRSPSTVQLLPNPTNSSKAPVQSSTLQTRDLEETEESPTTDRVEESDVACDGAQCYASRFPYHWTTDATWALASMVFLISILTFFVLYTGLWKKRNPMSYPLESGQPPNPSTKINIAELLKTRLASIPRHLRSKRQVHRKRMNGRRYEELPLHQSNGSCNSEERDYFFEDEDEEDLYLRDEHAL